MHKMSLIANLLGIGEDLSRSGEMKTPHERRLGGGLWWGWRFVPGSFLQHGQGRDMASQGGSCGFGALMRIHHPSTSAGLIS